MNNMDTQYTAMMSVEEFEAKMIEKAQTLPNPDGAFWSVQMNFLRHGHGGHADVTWSVNFWPSHSDPYLSGGGKTLFLAYSAMIAEKLGDGITDQLKGLPHEQGS